MSDLIKAPELQIQEWLNADSLETGSHSLSAYSGKAIFITAFQMLCPACVSHGLPQKKQVYASFRREDVVVLGLHTVFEHHAAMQRISLEAFLYENRIQFPVGIDQPDPEHAIPLTMHRYAMRGTPTTILIDKHGYLRKQLFGHEEDLILGAEIASLVAEV